MGDYFEMIIKIALDCKILICVLLVFNVLDIVSAIPKIIRDGYKSSTMREGLISKLMLYIAVIVAVCLDLVLNLSGKVSKIVLYFFIANEGLSIIENIGVVVELPAIITDLLKDLKNYDNVAK